MPSGISLDQHSFTVDVLKQLDCETTTPSAIVDISNVEIESIHSITTTNSTAEPSNEQFATEQTTNGQITNDIPQNRRRSAGELIRKSSLFLTKKRPLTWTLKKKKSTCPPLQDIFTPSQPTKKVSKIAINATLSATPSQNMNDMQPLVITHYPPKPLRYSPVEPLPEQNHNESRKSKTLHRLSIPLLKMTAALQQHENNNTRSRRRSDSDVVYTTEQENNSFLSKKWNKFVSTWKKGLKKKKNEPNIHL
ncbi:hypothetical protein G6F43_001133 [Rhizopus delemar]|nr:hypothetical protein G6F43_001133 [Rhizopus delemar]